MQLALGSCFVGTRGKAGTEFVFVVGRAHCGRPSAAAAEAIGAEAGSQREAVGVWPVPPLPQVSQIWRINPLPDGRSTGRAVICTEEGAFYWPH